MDVCMLQPTNRPNRPVSPSLAPRPLQPSQPPLVVASTITKREQIVAVLSDRIRAVWAGSIDPATGAPYTMPSGRANDIKDSMERSLCYAWSDAKSKGSRIEELRAELSDLIECEGFDLDAFVDGHKRNVGYTPGDQLDELSRLVGLVHAGDVDETTGAPAHMPYKHEKAMGLGELWHGMKSSVSKGAFSTRKTRRDHLAELIADKHGLDLDTFIAVEMRVQATRRGQAEQALDDFLRLAKLVNAKAIDPQTEKPAKMPGVKDRLYRTYSSVRYEPDSWQRAVFLQRMTAAGIDAAQLFSLNKPRTFRAPQTNHPIEAQLTELARLIVLVNGGAIDPTTNRPARMPSVADARLGIGRFWQRIHNRGTNVAKLNAVLAPYGTDVAKFIKKWKSSKAGSA